MVWNAHICIKSCMAGYALILRFFLLFTLQGCHSHQWDAMGHAPDRSIPGRRLLSGLLHVVAWKRAMFSMGSEVADPANLTQLDLSIVPVVKLSTNRSSSECEEMSYKCCFIAQCMRTIRCTNTEVSGKTIEYKRLFTDESGLKSFSCNNSLAASQASAFEHSIFQSESPLAKLPVASHPPRRAQQSGAQYSLLLQCWGKWHVVPGAELYIFEIHGAVVRAVWCRSSANKYPLRVGLIADVGQTANSSITMRQLMRNQPEVVLMAGDNSYADNYGARDPNFLSADGTNQMRWDSYFKLWEPLYASAPLLNAVGNHEIGAAQAVTLCE
eukprot:360458-Chlamydomonas_euryale.AAC.12